MLNTKVQKRICSDIAELGKNLEELTNNGIYWHINEDNMRDIRIVITGQEGTPYADCPFLFHFSYPDNYPLSPPTGKFCTSDGHTRFNPNLYIEGKICLSILGTWSGPSWTPVMTTMNIIMSISGLVMHSEPVKNEPGWESSSQFDVDEYNSLIEFSSLKTALLGQLKSCPQHFLPLHQKMIDRFKKDFPKILERIDRNMEKINEVKLIKPRYGPSGEVNYLKLKADICNFAKELGLEVPDFVTPPPVVEKVDEGLKPHPKHSAAIFEIGTVADVDGVKYEVKVNKNGKNFWKKL